MPTINEIMSTVIPSTNIDWNSIEAALGFQLHENIKTVCSRILINEDTSYISDDDFPTLIDSLSNIPNSSDFDCECEITLNEQHLNVILDEAHLKAHNGQHYSTTFYAFLFLADSANPRSLVDFFKERFYGDWNRNKFKNKMQIGHLEQDLIDEELYLFFNNDSGCFELCVFDNYIIHYENCTHVTIAKSAEEFLSKLRSPHCKRHFTNNEIRQRVQEYLTKKKY